MPFNSFFFLDSNQTTKVDFRKLTQNLRHEVIIIHLTNKLKDTSNVQRVFEIISEKLKTYLRTILILSGISSLFILTLF